MDQRIKKKKKEIGHTVNEIKFIHWANLCLSSTVSYFLFLLFLDLHCRENPEIEKRKEFGAYQPLQRLAPKF